MVFLSSIRFVSLERHHDHEKDARDSTCHGSGENRQSRIGFVPTGVLLHRFWHPCRVTALGVEIIDQKPSQPSGLNTRGTGWWQLTARFSRPLSCVGLIHRPQLGRFLCAGGCIDRQLEEYRRRCSGVIFATTPLQLARFWNCRKLSHRCDLAEPEIEVS